MPSRRSWRHKDPEGRGDFRGLPAATSSYYGRQPFFVWVLVVCDEKIKLLRDYQIATVGYSFAVSQFAHNHNPGAQGDLERLVEDTHKIAEAARSALRAHEIKYGC